jgi:hypothetical protein
MCGLPGAVLFVFWSLFPAKPGSYAQGDPAEYQFDRGFLEAGAVPPYNPSNLFPAAALDTGGKADKSAKTAVADTGSETFAGFQQGPLTDQNSHEKGGFSRGRGSEEMTGIVITGQTTLRDIEKETGISTATLADRLGLPRNTSPDERFGRLRKRYSLTVHAARDIISSLVEQEARR